MGGSGGRPFGNTGTSWFLPYGRRSEPKDVTICGEKGETLARSIHIAREISDAIALAASRGAKELGVGSEV